VVACRRQAVDGKHVASLKENQTDRSRHVARGREPVEDHGVTGCSRIGCRVTGFHRSSRRQGSEAVCSAGSNGLNDMRGAGMKALKQKRGSIRSSRQVIASCVTV